MHHAVIVAGGQGSRMRASAPLGTPAKPLLEFLFGGDATPAPTLLDNTVGTVQDALSSGGETGCCVVVGPPMDLPVSVERARETPAFSGPASAISAGVDAILAAGAAESDLVFVLAADEVDPAVAIEALLTAAGEETDREGWIISRESGEEYKIEPLLCLLNVGAARRAFAGVRGGSVRKVLSGLDLVEVPASAAKGSDKNSGQGVDKDVDTWDEAQAAGIGVAPGPATWHAARARVAAVAEVMWQERLERAEARNPAMGQVIASSVQAPMDVPHYTSSAMDGYAVSGPGPWKLLDGHVEGAQGRNIHRKGGRLQPGEALPVLTGSLLPDGTEAVVRSEHTQVRGNNTFSQQGTGSGDKRTAKSGNRWAGAEDNRQGAAQDDRKGTATLHLLDGMTVSPGADIRHAGEELNRGEELLPAGTVLSAQHLALLGACAVDTVRVLPPLTVDFAFTGNEVLTTGIPGPGEVRDAFSSSFPALVEQLGGEVRSISRLQDDPEEVQQWLKQAKADIVVITGGSGHSGQDFARTFITDQADVLLTESVRCAPGHPTLLAARQRESLDTSTGHPENEATLTGTPITRTQLLMGVPGNPLAAHVALHSFFAPAVAVIRGQEFPATHVCVAGEDIPAIHKPRTRLIPARLSSRGNIATVMTRTNSHMLSGYAQADALLIAPPEGVQKGQSVPYLTLPQ